MKTLPRINYYITHVHTLTQFPSRCCTAKSPLHCGAARVASPRTCPSTSSHTTSSSSTRSRRTAWACTIACTITITIITGHIHIHIRITISYIRWRRRARRQQCQQHRPLLPAAARRPCHVNIAVNMKSVASASQRVRWAQWEQTQRTGHRWARLCWRNNAPSKAQRKYAKRTCAVEWITKPNVFVCTRDGSNCQGNELLPCCWASLL